MSAEETTFEEREFVRNYITTAIKNRMLNDERQVYVPFTQLPVKWNMQPPNLSPYMRIIDRNEKQKRKEKSKEAIEALEKTNELLRKQMAKAPYAYFIASDPDNAAPASSMV